MRNELTQHCTHTSMRRLDDDHRCKRQQESKQQGICALVEDAYQPLQAVKIDSAGQEHAEELKCLKIH